MSCEGFSNQACKDFAVDIVWVDDAWLASLALHRAQHWLSPISLILCSTRGKGWLFMLVDCALCTCPKRTTSQAVGAFATQPGFCSPSRIETQPVILLLMHMRPDLPEACLGVVRHCSQRSVKAFQHSQAPCHSHKTVVKEKKRKEKEKKSLRFSAIITGAPEAAARSYKTVVSLWL